MKILTTKSEDQAFVRGLKEGDHEVVEKMYRKFFPAIKGFIKTHGGSVEDAEDVFQEGLMVFYRMVQKPDFKLTSSFLSLLYPICRNIWYKSLRKRPQSAGLDTPEAMEQAVDTDIMEIINQREIQTLFRKKLGTMGEQCRNLLSLFFEGTSMKEIVKKMALSSVSFAQKKKFQCKEKLVCMVKEDPSFNELKV